MFKIAEYYDEETFPAEEKEPPEQKLTWKADPEGAKEPGSPASPGHQELRRRIGSDAPLPEPDTPDELGTFRARSRSAPPNLWAAQRYGRELRRMSDEFHGALQKLPRPKSAGAASQMYRTTGWKETLQSWWSRGPPSNEPPRGPP
ncbi:bcl2-associated agonist of cell death [Hemicordylus capensis]|uniref:bcl2-associated agonist of cell death n=1 Tax=Hemicordylus capensis TaxID=884348 RepID=UPI002304314C|nr:bcl2-associated agonist of cell death [Hemicordylus capensis]